MPNTAIPARDTGYNVVHTVSKVIPFSNTSVVTIGTVPKGAAINSAGIVVTTAFNAGTTNVFDLGTSDDPDGFGTALAAGTIGLIAADEFATSNDVLQTKDIAIVAQYAPAGTAATAGSAVAFVTYFMPG